MQVTERPLSEVKPYPKNAKEHTDKQVKQIADSIREFGFNRPLVVDKSGVLVVGHGAYLAALLIGMETAPVLEVDLSEEKAKAYRLADNKLNESEWKMDLVIEELKGLSEETFKLTGFLREDFDGKVLASEIDQLARERDIDLGKYNVVTVEAPEAPRLKARVSFYFESIEDFEKVKKFFDARGGELDTAKLMAFVGGR